MSEYNIASPVVSESEPVRRDYAEKTTRYRLTVSVAGQEDTDEITRFCGEDVQAWIRLIHAQELYKISLDGVPVAYLPMNWIMQDLIVAPTLDLIDRTSLMNSILDHMKTSGFKDVYMAGDAVVSQKYAREAVRGLEALLNPWPA